MRMEEKLQYKKAKTWQIALATMTGAGQMVFYMLMTSATYIGNANFGILVAVTGVIITASRILWNSGSSHRCNYYSIKNSGWSNRSADRVFSGTF